MADSRSLCCFIEVVSVKKKKKKFFLVFTCHTCSVTGKEYVDFLAIFPFTGNFLPKYAR